MTDFKSLARKSHSIPGSPNKESVIQFINTASVEELKQFIATKWVDPIVRQYAVIKYKKLVGEGKGIRTLKEFFETNKGK